MHPLQIFSFSIANNNLSNNHSYKIYDFDATETFTRKQWKNDVW